MSFENSLSAINVEIPIIETKTIGIFGKIENWIRTHPHTALFLFGIIIGFIAGKVI
jgi:hypothetical protein